MSSQRSDWRERLHANPSRMEQELAIKLQDNGISKKSQLQLSFATKCIVLENFFESRVVGFNRCPLIADSTVGDLIVPRYRLENGLGSIRMLMSVETSAL